ncbi:MAG: heavy metal translocating P-type ATPase [Candidatus Margulisbacteria bacterium]|jgi:Cd2+/Zn2+-exporting ATPase|nr:heavy metal translocating P-type ATPase [Candidatus Margulisiibacteriota bacterium]
MVETKSCGCCAKDHAAQNLTEEREESADWRTLLPAFLAAAAAEIIELFYGGHWLVFVLALAAIAGSGLPVYKQGLLALFRLDLNMNALMAVAVTGALLIGHWPEAAMVMVLFALSEVIEEHSLGRARQAIGEVLKLAPEKATVQQANGSWRETAAEQVAAGSVVRVKPGEKIALDGVVLSGHSFVDQAPITGESIPVEKNKNAAVFAGTLNTTGSFTYRVTALAKDSTLARIIHAVEKAQENKAPVQRFVDRFARIYTPAVFLLALFVAVLPPLFTGEWLNWLYKALVLLVTACPCALVISIPVGIVSGLANAARQGILIKGGVFLENGRHLRWLALDKTGTLTEGRPRQTDFKNWTKQNPAVIQTLAASLAARSDHPVSQALAAAARQKNLKLKTVSKFRALPGRGIEGRIGAKTYYLVNHRMIKELNLGSRLITEQLEHREKKGYSTVLLADTEKVLGLFAAADTLKKNSRQAVAALHRLGVKTIILTGDNQHTAQAIAGQAGIDTVAADLLPEDKLTEIEKLLSSKYQVGMVGDGINDAPALARADIGFAMGAAGSDTAIETAAVALMTDDLSKVPDFIRLSRRTAGVLRQNIIFALGVKALFFYFTLFGEATMWLAVFADVGVSLLVVFNSLRLLQKDKSLLNTKS